MSDLLLPPGIQMPEPIQQVEEPNEEIPIEERGRMLPKPTGWKILCGVPWALMRTKTQPSFLMGLGVNPATLY